MVSSFTIAFNAVDNVGDDVEELTNCCNTRNRNSTISHGLGATSICDRISVRLPEDLER